MLLLLSTSLQLTWDQALFSFRFENYIPAGKAKRKESLMQPFYETPAAHFFDWLTFAESAIICFPSMVFQNFPKPLSQHFWQVHLRHVNNTVRNILSRAGLFLSINCGVC